MLNTKIGVSIPRSEEPVGKLSAFIAYRAEGLAEAEEHKEQGIRGHKPLFPYRPRRVTDDSSGL
jgi:hypothetical protein